MNVYVGSLLLKNVLILLIPSMALFLIDVGSFCDPKPGSAVAEARDHPTLWVVVIMSYSIGR